VSNFDRTGKPLGTVGSPGSFLLPKLSRDGKQVAAPRFDSQTGTYDIWLFDLSRGAESIFTTDPGDDQAVVWSPNGSQLVWASNREGSRDFYRKTSSGAGQDELFWKSDDGKYPNDWSGDGRFILYVELNPKNANDIWIMPLSGDRQPFPYLRTKFDENFARFSPDSKWVAYSSNESGSYEIYVQPFPATGGKWKISIKGGNFPLWRRDGKEIFYMAGGKLMAVKVTRGERFEAGLPRMLFDCASIGGGGASFGKYAVTGDGQKFLFATRVVETGTVLFTAVFNWTTDLKR
jgi:Tol biopolymer transport system component